MREEELYFSYRQMLYQKKRRKEGEVVAQMYRVRCIVGSCPVMIDISAQRFMCQYHMRSAKLSTPKGKDHRSGGHT